MVKPLTMIEIKTIIKNYIKDERKKQAVLLNGEWGCGKTFFIKEKLIPDLEEYQILQISLYGISSTERIQEIIYSKWIEKIIGNNTDKIGVFGNMVAKGIEIFGKSATQFVEKRLGVENTLEDIKKYFADSNLSNKQTILIFDDIERCRIEIIELMGFLNNLSENNNYKLILIANEKEITRDENINTTALKYGIALNERLDISKIKKKETDNEADKINREDLINIIKYYFGQTTTYERTREKLVGLTVPYSIPIKESFDAIINKYVKKEKDSVTKILKKNKNRIIELFESQAHKNLRTLIVSCIAIEDILSSIDKNQITKDDNMLADELDAIVVYTIYSAIRRTMGKEEYKWSIGNRYGKVNVSINEIKDSNIYGYAFVDEYWKMQCIDADIVHSDIRKRISERTEYENRLKANHNYQKLSLNKLREWYILDDDDIYSSLDKLKKELECKKYYPQDFKDIITTLLTINNPNYGLNFNESSDNVLYDTTDNSQFADINLNNQEIQQDINFKWRKIDIASYVELMVQCFDDPEFNLTKDMLRVLTEDKQFAYSYTQLVIPLLEQIEKKELHDMQENPIISMPWDNNFENYCYDKRSDFIKLGRFLSLFDYHDLTKRLVYADAKEIHYFFRSLEEVYYFVNLDSIYSQDYEIVRNLRNYVSSNIDTVLNKKRSRTKAIWLKQLEINLEKYESDLEQK